MWIEIPFICSTKSFLLNPWRFYGGKSKLFYFTMSKLYLKSPVNKIVPMYPLNNIIDDPGICLASNSQKSTNSPGLI